MEGRIPNKAVPGWITLGIAVVLLCLGLVCSVDVLASWASWGPHVTVTVTVPGTGGRHSDDGTGTYQDADGARHTVHLQGACAGRKLGYRFWPGLSRGWPVLVEQSAETAPASDPVDLGREEDHVRFVVGSAQKHPVALVAAPGVVMSNVDVEHVV